MPEPSVIHCPWCGEPVDIFVDQGQPAARITEDCAVCCQPIELEISMDAAGQPMIVDVSRENG